MNRRQFSEFVRNPDSVNAQSLKALEELVIRYPYCQTGQILFTFNLFREGDLQFHSQLKKAAAYSADRKKLKELIEARNIGEEIKHAEKIVVPTQDVKAEIPEVSSVVTETCPIDQIVPDVNETPLPESSVLHKSLTIIDNAKFQERLSREELLAVVRKRLTEIEAEKLNKSPEENVEDGINQPILPDEYTAETNKVSSKNLLIEKFIRQEPRITPPKATFFNPTETSHRSNVDEEEIISETLAQLYASQGNIQKAIHIYEKLSLLNQEKCRYFAARIQELGQGR